MASPTMAELIKQRGWIKGSITRALNYAVDPPQNYSVEDIKVRINRLEKLWSEFVSATYALSNFSDDPQKFHYLKSLLSDDAAKLVQHIPVSNSAYRTAWNRLNYRYNRPRHIIN